MPGLRKSSKPLPPSVTGPARVIAYDGLEITRDYPRCPEIRPVRVITYDGLDTNTCCGTHVHSTAHLQACRARHSLDTPLDTSLDTSLGTP